MQRTLKTQIGHLLPARKPRSENNNEQAHKRESSVIKLPRRVTEIRRQLPKRLVSRRQQNASAEGDHACMHLLITLQSVCTE